MVEIPYLDLGAETLTAVIEAFVLREGTDYGAEEASLKAKVDAVRRQIEKGRAKLMFDPASETCTIVPAS